MRICILFMVTVYGNCLEIRICHFSVYMYRHVYICLYALAGRFFTPSATWEAHRLVIHGLFCVVVSSSITAKLGIFIIYGCLILYIFVYSFIYLAVPGLNCSMQESLIFLVA